MKYIVLLLSIFLLCGCDSKWKKGAEGSYRSYGFKRNDDPIYPTAEFRLTLNSDYSCVFIIDGKAVKGSWELETGTHKNYIYFTVGEHKLKSTLMVGDEKTSMIYITNDGLLGNDVDEVSFLSINDKAF